MIIKNLYKQFVSTIKILDWMPILFIRLLLAYGFYGPAMNKLKNIDDIISWFESMEMPLPALNAYLVTVTEGLGVLLLFLGVGVRIISIPLIITMLVAIKTVHWENGFAASDNGFEIPFYYVVMLIVLLFYGEGKASIGYTICKYVRKHK